MADFGNHFTTNSGNFRHNTSGHQEADSDWVIVNRPNDTRITYKGFEATTNNCKTVPFTFNDTNDISYNQVRNGSEYIAYFTLENNENNTGDITEIAGAHLKNNWYTLNSDDYKSMYVGQTPYISEPPLTPNLFLETGTGNIWQNTLAHTVPLNLLYENDMVWYASCSPRGYRKANAIYKPYIEFDKESNNDGTETNHATIDTTTQYDIYQTFLNHPDPYARLHVYIENHDNPNSTSPVFAKLRSSNSSYALSTHFFADYKHDFSYSYTFTERGADLYNSRKMPATWSDKFKIEITYNRLPTYPKELVFTYNKNIYNKMSYDGQSIDVEAKALLNGTYQGFTTSTATDTGFHTYTRYAYITYNYATYNTNGHENDAFHSFDKPSYTFTICQMPSQMTISYAWSIDNNPEWASLSETKGNKTTVTFIDQGDIRPAVEGSFVINNLTTYKGITYISNGGTASGTIDGITWTAPKNVKARSCTLRNKMNIEKCIAQNITPKNATTGMPEKTMVITQSAMTWNNPEVDMNWRVTYYSSDTSTYNDDYAFCYPTVTIGQVSSTNNDIKTNRWKYSTTSYNISVVMPKFNRPWVHTQTNGKVYITKEEGIIGYKGGSKKIYFRPEISFINGYTSGVSERVWKLSNTSNNNVQEQTGSIKTFDDMLLKMPSIPAQDHAFGSAVLTWKNSGETGYRDDFTFDYKSKSWNNNNDNDSITTSVGGNLPNIGNWRAIVDNGQITFTSTTRDAPTRTGKILFECSTYQDGKVTPSPSSLLFQQYGTNITGTITIKGEGSGLETYDSSVDYPMNFAIFTTKYSLRLKEYIHVTKVENLVAKITSPTNRNVKWQGESITFGKKSGTVTTETEASKTYPYKITVTSNIVSTYPSNVSDGVILNGKVKPYEANYVTEYSVDGGSWTTSTTATIGSRGAVWASSPSLVVRSSGWTNVNEGIYKYTRGWYASRGSTTHTVSIRVRDKNNGDKVFSGTSASITQDSQDGYPTDTKYTFATDGTNCTTSTPSATSSTSGNYGSFTVSPSSPISDPSGNQGSDNDITKYIYNYSNKLSEGNWDSTTISVTFTGSNKTFGYSESVSMKFGVTSSSPDTKVWIYTGKKTWNYKYKFGIKASNENNYHYSTLTGTGSTGPYSPITYYRKISFDGGSTWKRLDENGESTITLTSTGTYTVKVGWWSGTDGPYHTKYHTITLDKITRIYRLLVSLSGDYNKDAFDTTAWTLTATVTAQYKESSGDWTNTTTPSGISYSWSGASSTNSTATVAVSSVSMGSDGNSLGTKNVTVSVSLSGYSGDSATVTLGRYGKSYYNG